MSETADWLIVESYPNWLIDQRNNFSYFGITARFEKLVSTMKVGDRLFTYVTGKSCFSDIRQVAKTVPRKLPMGGDYEQSLPLCIDTKLLFALPLDQWVPIKTVVQDLVLTRDKVHWGQVFRSAPRRLEPRDGAYLRKIITSRHSSH